MGEGSRIPSPHVQVSLGSALKTPASTGLFCLSRNVCPCTLLGPTFGRILCFYPALSQNLISLSLGQVPALPLLNPETLQLLVTSFTKVFGLNQKMCINSSAQRLALGTYSIFVRCFCDASIQPYFVLAMTVPDLKMRQLSPSILVVRDLESRLQSHISSFHRVLLMSKNLRSTTWMLLCSVCSMATYWERS